MRHLIALMALTMAALAGLAPAQAQPGDEALAVVYNALEDTCDFAAFAQSYPESAFAPLAAQRGAACSGNAPITGMPAGAPSESAAPAATWRAHDRTRWDTADTDAIVGGVVSEAGYRRLDDAARAGDGTAALILGLARWDALGVYRHRVEAVEMFEAACEAGLVHGCARLGYAYTDDGPIAEDLFEARRLLDGACSAGDLYGCAFLGYLYAVGAGGVAEDDVRAVELYRRACEGGVEGPGCGQLGFMYANGHGVAINHARANTLLRQGCAAEYSAACTNLASSYFRGRGVVQDQARANELWIRSCRLGYGFACREAGRYALGEWGARRNENTAFDLFERGCGANFQDACTRLARLRGQVQARGLPARSRYRWHDASDAELSAACDGGREIACLEGALRRDEITDNTISALLRLCAAGDTFACGRWGHTYLMGHGRASRTAIEAAEQTASACEAGELWACGVAAVQLWPHAATSDDQQRIRHLGHRGCRGDITLGCRLYAASYVASAIANAPAAEAEVEAVLEEHCATVSPDNYDLIQTEACWTLSRIYQTERGVPADPARARANARLACGSGEGLSSACDWLEDNG